jgi:hypothetical protein
MQRLLDARGRSSCLRLILRMFGVSQTRLQLFQIGCTREQVPRKVSAIRRAALKAHSAMRASFGAQKVTRIASETLLRSRVAD